MRNFFIDLENVRSYGLEGVLLLNPDDRVYVFYSDNANTLTIPTIESLSGSPASIKYIKTNYIGANAMDFQIVTLLGASIEQQKKGSFYIISHDNGFKSAVKFCEGYFTGYEIITGVYANILLALNSENSRDEQKKTEQNASVPANTKTRRKKSQKKADKNQTGASEAKPADNQDAGSDKADVAGNNADKTDKNVKAAGNTGKNRPQTERTGQNNENTPEKNGAAVDTAAEQVKNEAQSSDEKTSDSKNTAGKNRNSSRNRKNRTKNQDGTAGNSMTADAETAPQETETVPDEKQKTDADKAKAVKQKPEKRKPEKSGIQGKKENASEKGQAGEEPKSMKYVYNALSDYLSKTTIDLYAKKIDEGIRSSSNRNELHEFFRKSYGSDEAEALYKIVASDFDDMKKHVN